MEDGVARIIEKIHEDVRWKVEEFRKEAQEKIERIRKEEYERWEREREKLLHDGRREAEGIRSLIISRAHLRGKREVMEAREEIMQRVVEEIKRNARGADGYYGYIENMVKEARGIFGDEFVVVCIPEDKARVNEIVSRVAPGARIEMGPVKHGGIIARDLQGTKSVDYSIDALVNRNINRIRKKIVEKLFEGEYA